MDVTQDQTLPAGKPRRATIVDVGIRAGVSTASVSKVLRNAYGVSDAMRERVNAAMAELGYRPHRPARGMRGRTFSIGMMVSDLENPFFDLLADGILSVLGEQGYELLISPGGVAPAGQKTAIESLIDHQMDGLILVAPFLSADGLDDVLREVPTVAVGNHSRDQAYDTVSSDDARGAGLVIDHLVGLGHRRIAFVANETQPAEPGRPEGARLRGFEAAMRRHGLENDSVIVKHFWSLEGGRAAARTIQDLDERPTAVFAGADIVAFGIMSELWQRGQSVPDAYSLVGYDNSRMSSVGPIALTTIDQSGFEMGQRAGRLLLERIGGRTEARHELLTPTLVNRGTTAAR